MINPIIIGSLNDFIVKKDGVELSDVDYSTLKIIYNLNSTPSEATFVLARRHDNFNYDLDGNYSQVDNENKIEIYDNTRKLFTGYITQIQGISSNDTVGITAHDARYKLSRNSLDIWYGGKIEVNDDYIPGGFSPSVQNITTKRTIGEALSLVFTACSSYLAGTPSPSFTTSYTPEYMETESTLSELLDTLIGQTANANWYVDENEVLQYQRVSQGSIKEIALSSLNSQRLAYDAILTDVSLNKQSSAYAKSLNVKLGKHIIRRWARRYFTGWAEDYIEALNKISEKIVFAFQQWGNTGRKWYCGIFSVLYSYATSTDWIVKTTLVAQYQSKDTDEDLDDITVGSGLPTRTHYLNYYGKKETNNRWEEEQRENDVYLVSVTEESYDYTTYATDLANFELSQNNQLQTEADISMLLDAFNYYNISLENRINLVNTIDSNIYKNNNGFPLNIDRIEINCATRTVNLSLSNYGKSWYVKTASAISNYNPSRTITLYKKERVIQYSQGL